MLPAESSIDQYNKVSMLGAITTAVLLPKRAEEFAEWQQNADANYDIGQYFVGQTGAVGPYRKFYVNSAFPEIHFLQLNQTRRKDQSPVAGCRFICCTWTPTPLPLDQLLQAPALDVMVAGEYRLGRGLPKLISWSYANGAQEALDVFLAAHAHLTVA